ncbi:MAG: hypothetical protein ABIN67_03015 [Ferruginibacter sp.]
MKALLEEKYADTVKRRRNTITCLKDGLLIETCGGNKNSQRLQVTQRFTCSYIMIIVTGM